MALCLSRRWFVSCLIAAASGCDDDGNETSRSFPSESQTTASSSDLSASTSVREMWSGTATESVVSTSTTGATSDETDVTSRSESSLVDSVTGDASSVGPRPSDTAAVGGTEISTGSFADAGDLETSGRVDWQATPDVCTFELSATLSEVIPTVGVVGWSTDLVDIEEAHIEFVLDDPQAGEVNLGSGGAIPSDEGRALMLGLKPDRSYTYRIVVRAGTTICSSQTRQLMTAAYPEPIAIERGAHMPESRANGFALTCAYQGEAATIVDADGAVVWQAQGPIQCARAHMDWQGSHMWMLNGNASFGASDHGFVKRVRMDGTGDEDLTAGLEYAHHDFAVLPDGVTAFLIGDPNGNDDASFIVERSSEGELNTVVRLDEVGYGQPLRAERYHANAVRYYARDDSYTVSDLGVGIAKFSRQGELLFLVTGDCGEVASRCAVANVAGSHGHDLLANGNLLFFAATIGTGGESPVFEYRMNAPGDVFTVTQAWSYRSEVTSLIFGDVQRLTNGNTLVTYSSSRVMHEVDGAGALVQTLGFPSLGLGYVNFRERLYGSPQ